VRRAGAFLCRGPHAILMRSVDDGRRRVSGVVAHILTAGSSECVCASQPESVILTAMMLEADE
jgi:hypothetical protein